MNTLIEDSYSIKKDKMQAMPFDFQKEAFEVSELPEMDFITQNRSTPMWSFKSHRKKLISSRPIGVKITKGESLYFAENENLDIYANGATINEAIEDFIEQVVYFYEHYKNLDFSSITGEAIRLKKLYSDFFHS